MAFAEIVRYWSFAEVCFAKADFGSIVCRDCASIERLILSDITEIDFDGLGNAKDESTGIGDCEVHSLVNDEVLVARFIAARPLLITSAGNGIGSVATSVGGQPQASCTGPSLRSDGIVVSSRWTRFRPGRSQDSPPAP